MSDELKVNGRLETVEGSTIVELLQEKGIDPERPGIAVGLNGGLVRRANWSETKLKEGDEIEIVAPMSGG